MLPILSTLKFHWYRCKISGELRKDLVWWHTFLMQFNGVTILPNLKWCRPDDSLATDACLTGCGGLLNGRYFHRQFPAHIQKAALDINCLELLSVLAAVKLWARELAGRHLTIICDNQVTVEVLNRGRARNVILLSYLREIAFLCAIHEFELRAVHIAGVDNRMPDLLSRWHLDPKYERLFLEQVGDQPFEECTCPDKNFKVTTNW